MLRVPLWSQLYGFRWTSEPSGSSKALAASLGFGPNLILQMNEAKVSRSDGHRLQQAFLPTEVSKQRGRLQKAPTSCRGLAQDGTQPPVR